MRSNTAVLNNSRLQFFALLTALVVLAAFYIVSVNQTVRNVASRQAIESELSTLRSKIAELEYSYISMKNSITPESAYMLGFEPVGEVTYVSRKSSVALADIGNSTQ